MRLSDRFRAVAGFLAAGSTDHPSRKGTFLVAQIGWQQWLGHAATPVPAKYMVTARHIIDTHGDLNAVAFRADDLAPEFWHVAAESWTYSDALGDATGDLAVRPFDPPGSVTSEFLGLPVGFGVHHLSQLMELGQVAFVVGLLAWEHRDLPWNPRPIVRTASIAALDQVGVRWGKSLQYTAPEVHLLDTRSRAGFSGSPCFVQYLLPDSRREEVPRIWEEIACFAGTDLNTMGTLRTVTHWMGLLVGYADESGIGIVIPSGAIESALNAMHEAR